MTKSAMNQSTMPERAATTAMSFDEALQLVVTVAVTQLKPQDQRLRHALRVVINFQALRSSKPLLTNAHLDALQRLVDRRDSQ